MIFIGIKNLLLWFFFGSMRLTSVISTKAFSPNNYGKTNDARKALYWFQSQRNMAQLINVVNWWQRYRFTSLIPHSPNNQEAWTALKIQQCFHKSVIAGLLINQIRDIHLAKVTVLQCFTLTCVLISGGWDIYKSALISNRVRTQP